MRKAKRKVQYCQTVVWAKSVWNCIKIGKMSSFQMNPHSKPIPIWRLKHEQIYPHNIDGWIKIHYGRIEATFS